MLAASVAPCERRRVRRFVNGRTVIAAASRSASGGRGGRATPTYAAEPATVGRPAPAVRSAPGRRGARRGWRPPCRRRGEPRTGEGPGEPANREPEARRRLGRVGDGRHRSRAGPRRARVPDCVDRRASPDRVSGGKRREERRPPSPSGLRRDKRVRRPAGRAFPGGRRRGREVQRRTRPDRPAIRVLGPPEGRVKRKTKRRDEVDGAFREPGPERGPLPPGRGHGGRRVSAGMRRNRFRRDGGGRTARGTVGAAAATGRIMGPLCDGAPVPRVSFKAAARDAAGFPGVVPGRHRRRVDIPRLGGMGATGDGGACEPQASRGAGASAWSRASCGACPGGGPGGRHPPPV